MHPRQQPSRDKPMELARGRELEAFERSIDVQISRGRLIEDDSARPRSIRTVGGFGYVFLTDDTSGRGNR
jgi:two-component system phosphate regulon response regulator OmpR